MNASQCVSRSEKRKRKNESGPLRHMPHKFILGQAVEYTPPRRLYAPPGIYVVTAKLPERDGEFEYHIKHTSELHERIARESELQAVGR
jgi:hypothetical protein